MFDIITIRTLVGCIVVALCLRLGLFWLVLTFYCTVLCICFRFVVLLVF